MIPRLGPGDLSTRVGDKPARQVRWPVALEDGGSDEPRRRYLHAVSLCRTGGFGGIYAPYWWDYGYPYYDYGYYPDYGNYYGQPHYNYGQLNHTTRSISIFSGPGSDAARRLQTWIGNSQKSEQT